jgi:hypothetical protein
MRYRDPECDCEIEYPDGRRLLCDHCRTDGPLPGSLADPDWEQRHNIPAVLIQAYERVTDTHPELAAQLLRAADLLDQNA